MADRIIRAPCFQDGHSLGGAWNAGILAEHFRFERQTYSTIGVGALISGVTGAKNFNLLLAGTIALAAVVVTTNGLV